jgi:replicative DNA helicase
MADLNPERRRRDASTRVPPHNLEAEASLIGALLLSKDALVAVAETGVVAGDFYKPAHQHLFEAIRVLASAGEPVDAVTVAEELRRNGLLSELGGVGLLLELQAATPAVSNAARYARIVQDTALLRRLIAVSSDIAELAYDEPDDVSKVLDEAETKVFEIAERRVTDSTKAIGDLLPLTLNDLEQRYERGIAVTGTPTGFTDVDELLAGLQPATLNVVGARPSMGKCVAADTEVLDPATGELVTAADLYERGRRGDWVQVLSLGRKGRFKVTTPCAYVDDGRRPVYEVRTRLGRIVRTTASHPFLTPDGWRPCAELTEGMRVAVAARLPWFGHDGLAAAEVLLLAHLLGDGGLRVGAARRRDDAVQRCRSMDVDALALLRRHDLSHIDDDDVALPRAVQRLPRRQLLAFLTRLLEENRLVRPGAPREVTFVACSERLARDVQHLLLRFGVITALRGTTGFHRRARRAVHALDLDAATARTVDADAAARLGLPVRPLVPAPVASGGASTLAGADSVRPHVGWDEVVAVVPAGVQRVFDLTVPELHSFLAADVVVHNTAFALGVATHVAVEEALPVLFFSLEMGHKELTQRILAAEARVDSQKMRTGRLSEQDWSKIGRAIGRLEAPLFIDDNPNVTVMEIRAKSRRLAQRYGQLGLVVVDYLQLMSGRLHAENRQVEVSEISRGLKILAREIGVPIVALSQLSRNLESRQDKRPMLADLRESGCLTATTRIARSDNNEEVTLGELLAKGARDVPIWTLDARHRLVPAVMTAAFASGVKDVFALRLASGRCVEASANHPFLTLDGWRRLDGLAVGTRVASARRLPLPASDGALAALRRGSTWVLERTATAAAPDVRWDAVVGVTPLGAQPVFDATVPGTHNFLANGVVVHNSIEQDADVVLFIYRDEVYNPDTADKAVAEIIVAKHRNGPIGLKRLVFLGPYTRFENAAKGL